MDLVAAEAAESSASPIVSLFWIALAAAPAPVISRLLRGYVPDVVLLLVFGILIGPHALAWAGSGGGVELVGELGLGMLFLLAGYELDPRLLRGRSGGQAWAVWVVCLALAFAAVAALTWWEGLAGPEMTRPSVTSVIAVAIAMTSTALGTLLPIVKQDGLLTQPLGRAVLAHGAVGELGPIVAMSVLLTSRSLVSALVVLLLFVLAAMLVALVNQRVLDRVPGAAGLLERLSGGTTQLPVRVVFLLLLILMAVAETFDLDVVLGAFAAGLILRTLVPAGADRVGQAWETIGFGVFIPVFFVVSGMGIDIGAVVGSPLLWLGFVLTIAVVRGGPVWIGERFVAHGANLASGRERTRLALYAATGLPIIVAVTQVATSADLLGADVASTMVAAGATTVLVFPLVARLLGGGGEREPALRSGASRTQS
ncbi:cation:proton antiporter [Nocardia farcinica]|uniref:cation:proton antiporter n=1 Tax=Nocardia farcinica TaxID=37329 RepID=UPI002455B142|nr:cation:proton antiporter [Nocardia farcinica]